MKTTLKDRLATVAFVAANALLASEVVCYAHNFFKQENLVTLYRSLNQSVIETVLSPLQYMR